MKEEIYKKIIKNSKIPYLKINCKKDDNNKFIAIEVIDQSKEAERFFNLLTENNILNKEITDILFLYNANTFNSDDSILNIGM